MAACSESLYQLRYPGPQHAVGTKFFVLNEMKNLKLRNIKLRDIVCNLFGVLANTTKI